MMTEWEYKVETIYFQEDEQLQRHLQELGKQWWELLECWFKGEDDSLKWGVWLLFRRPSPTQQEGIARLERMCERHAQRKEKREGK